MQCRQETKMKAFLTNLSQLFHINGFAKKGAHREREIAFASDFITYLTAINCISAMEFISHETQRGKKVSKHYTFG